MPVNSNESGTYSHLPVLQIVGYKNSGKTTLACKAIAELSARGLRVGSAKHDAHRFQLDEPGTDSSKHLTHGSVETVLTSNTATRWMRQNPTTLCEISSMLNGRVDIIIAEGFKNASYPKIALIRESYQMEALIQETSDVRLWISWLNPEKLASNKTYTQQPIAAPIISIHDEEVVMNSIQSLVLSLFPSNTKFIKNLSI